MDYPSTVDQTLGGSRVCFNFDSKTGANNCTGGQFLTITLYRPSGWPVGSIKHLPSIIYGRSLLEDLVLPEAVEKALMGVFP